MHPGHVSFALFYRLETGSITGKTSGAVSFYDVIFEFRFQMHYFHPRPPNFLTYFKVAWKIATSLDIPILELGGYDLLRSYGFFLN